MEFDVNLRAKAPHYLRTQSYNSHVIAYPFQSGWGEKTNPRTAASPIFPVLGSGEAIDCFQGNYSHSGIGFLAAKERKDRKEKI